MLMLTMLLVTCFMASGQASALQFRHLTIEHGLSLNNVNTTFQDSRGFIWICTEDGLNRYDGYNFKIYKHNPANPASISSSFVRKIIEDDNGNLWIITDHGLNMYDWDTDSFVRYLHDPDNSNSIASNGGHDLFFDTKGRLWILTYDRISILDVQTGTFSLIAHDPDNPNSLPGNQSRHIAEDDQGRFWIATFNGLSFYDEQQHRFTNFMPQRNNPNSLSGRRIQKLLFDSKSRLWIGTLDRGISLYNPSTGNFTNFSHDPRKTNGLPHNEVHSIVESSDGSIWIGTSGGLSLYNETTQTFTNYSRFRGDPESLSSNVVTDIGFDSMNTMLISTRFGGVNIYDPDGKKFMHYRSNSLDTYGLNDNNVSSFAEDSLGNVWIGVEEGGLNYFDRKTNRFSHIMANPNNPGGLVNNKVIALAKDQFGKLWIGTWAGGVNVFDPKTNIFKHYINIPNVPNTLSGNHIFYILEDSKGIIWIATWDGSLSRYNRDTDDFTQYLPNPDDPHSLPQSPCDMIAEDHLGNLWIPHGGEGLSMYDREKDHFIRFVNTNEPGSLAHNNLSVVFEDSKQRLWVGTNGGLCLFHRETGTFTTYRTEHGLPGNVIVGILEDDHGNLWLSTNYGLSRFNPETLTCKNFDASDGLQSNQFNRWAFKKLSSGEMLFGGLNGFNLFHPDNIFENTFVPPVYTVGFRLRNEEVEIGPGSVLSRNILTTSRIELSHKHEMITFEFAALNYRQTERNQYMYMLEGFNDAWINLRNDRTVSFASLKPGDYTLRVVASNNDGVWNMDGASLEIKVLPPFYGTWWFRGLLIMVIIICFYSFYRYKLHAVSRKAMALEAAVRERTAMLDERNNELNIQTDALKKMNALLEQRQQMIEAQNKRLEQQTTELEAQRHNLEEQTVELEAQRHNLEGQTVELEAQRASLEEANSMLTKLNATKDKFFGIIAHDLKNPFNNILGLSEIMQMHLQKGNTEKSLTCADMLHKTSTSAYELLENLLTWSRTQSGHIQFEQVPVDLIEVFGETIRQSASAAQAKGIRLKSDLRHTITVFADHNMLLTILRNLVTNAIKFSNEGDEITLDATMADGCILIKVADTGIGMSEEVAEKIFMLDGNIKNPGTANEPGTGLGLILCKEFVEKHGGSIWVKSEPGIGSSFFFTLPGHYVTGQS